MNDVVNQWGPFPTEGPNGWWTPEGAAAMRREVARNTFRRSVIERARERFGARKRNAKRPRDASFELAFHTFWTQRWDRPVLPHVPGSPVIDITGLRFGKLVVEALSGRSGVQRREAVWRCRCDCGATCDVISSHLRYGGTKSCGCLKSSAWHATGEPTELTQAIVR
jgi:hypothetical protein